MIAAQLRRVASREEQREGEIGYLLWLEGFVGSILPWWPMREPRFETPEKPAYEVVRQGTGW